MPISPAKLLDQIGLSVEGTVRWNTVPKINAPGVYVISLSEDPKANVGLLPKAPIDVRLVDAWIRRVPSFSFRGQMQPAAKEVADFLSTFWFDDESIVYVGKATDLKSRLGQYRRHRLGNRSPHAGGHWIKTLTNLDDLFIHFKSVKTKSQALEKEDEALGVFKEQVSSRHRTRVHNSIPFANRAHPPSERKQTDISGDVLD